jgi:hypothetical protein
VGVPAAVEEALASLLVDRALEPHLQASGARGAGWETWLAWIVA